MNLVLPSLEQARAQVAAMPDSDRAQLSPDWLALLDAATSADPWVLGFELVHRETGLTIGQCGFKGPPSADGVVEIAYGVSSKNEGKGYATEAAQALVSFAFDHDSVVLVRAHTLPESNASGRVLTKCGFCRTEDVIDPDDGPVWRWEKQREL